MNGSNKDSSRTVFPNGLLFSLIFASCLCLFLAAPPSRLAAEDMDAENLKSKIIASYDFAKNRKIPQVITRQREAAVLMSGVEVPEATLYFIAKESDQWGLTQKIDLTELLDGARCGFNQLDYQYTLGHVAPLSIGMNDDWFVFGISDSPGTPPDDLCAVLIFHKQDGRWEYHSRIESRESIDPDRTNAARIDHKLDRRVLLTEDDNLIVSYENFETDIPNPTGDLPSIEYLREHEAEIEQALSNRGRSLEHAPSANKRGIAYVYTLNESSKPERAETILPPETAQYPLWGGMGMYTLLTGNYLFIHNYVPAPVTSGTQADHLPWNDYAVYEKAAGRWRYKTSLLSLVPEDTLESESVDFLYPYIYGAADENNLFIYYHLDIQATKVLKLSVEDGEVKFVCFETSPRSEMNPSFTSPQFPQQYTLFYYGPLVGVGGAVEIHEPSPDHSFHFAPTRASATVIDLRTLNYLNETIKERYRPQHILPLDRTLPVWGTHFMPLVNYSVFGATFIVSFHIDGLYLDDDPRFAMYARVWSGISIYEYVPGEYDPGRYDPVKNVFRMVTSQNRDLAVEPVPEQNNIFISWP